MCELDIILVARDRWISFRCNLVALA